MKSGILFFFQKYIPPDRSIAHPVHPVRLDSGCPIQQKPSAMRFVVVTPG
jgi:hypothetical protein